MKHYFAKECKSCGSRYYVKEITAEHFDNLVDGSQLFWERDDNEYFAIIMSYCTQHANDRATPD